MVARYILKASNDSGPVEFNDRLTIDQALEKARQLRDAHFQHITILNVLTGLEIHDVEALMQEQGDAGSGDKLAGEAD